MMNGIRAFASSSIAKNKQIMVVKCTKSSTDLQPYCKLRFRHQIFVKTQTRNIVVETPNYGRGGGDQLRNKVKIHF